MEGKRSGSLRPVVRKLGCTLLLTWPLFFGASPVDGVRATGPLTTIPGDYTNISSQVTPQTTPQAVPQRLRFTHITADQGLADNQVQPVLQDRSGFLWFGTY